MGGWVQWLLAVQLYEDALYRGGPSAPSCPNALQALPKMR
jgi:hypothetical protein